MGKETKPEINSDKNDSKQNLKELCTVYPEGTFHSKKNFEVYSPKLIQCTIWAKSLQPKNMQFLLCKIYPERI
jgi:hypothetical protein